MPVAGQIDWHPQTLMIGAEVVHRTHQIHGVGQVCVKGTCERLDSCNNWYLPSRLGPTVRADASGPTWQLFAKENLCVTDTLTISAVSTLSHGPTPHSPGSITWVTRLTLASSPTRPAATHSTAMHASGASHVTATTTSPWIAVGATSTCGMMIAGSSGLLPGNPPATNWMATPADMGWAILSSVPPTRRSRRRPGISSRRVRAWKSGN